jgi:hypothetical protein
MKKKTLKDFDQFLVEANLKKSKGLPSDFMSSAEEEATKNLGVRIDRPGPNDLSFLISQSTAMMNEGSAEEVDKRYKDLEQLAKDVIMDEFGFVLRASAKPIELDIRLVRSVISEIPELGQKAQVAEETPEYEDDDEVQEFEGQPQSQEDGQEDGQEDESQDEEDDFFSFFDDETPEEQEESEEEDVETLSNKEVSLAIDKKKLLNTITQGAGKATKDIIKLTDIVREGIEKIFGAEKGERILDIWGKISDEADKLDWIIPIGQKQAMFKNAPGGIAGATSVKWESVSNELLEINLLKENSDYNKIVIRAYGIDFPMLIHEATKGVHILLQSAAIKMDPELAKEIKRATSSYRDEAEEFRYGPLANQMFSSFVNNCAGAATFPNAKERIFGALALDKGRGGKFTDGEFLEMTKEIFSSFDKTEENGKIRFILNREKFSESKAKSEIEKIITEFNKIWGEYEEAMRNWEMEQKFGSESEGEYKTDEEPESEIDRLVRQTLSGEEEPEEVTNKEYKDMTAAEIQDEIQRAVRAEDYELAGYLKNTFLKGEAKRVWDIELKRINESKIRR